MSRWWTTPQLLQQQLDLFPQNKDLRQQQQKKKNQREHRARGLPVSPNSEEKHHERDFRYPQPIKWQSVQRNTLGVKHPKNSPVPVPPFYSAGVEPQVILSTSEGSSVILVMISGWVRQGDAHPFVFNKLPSFTWIINPPFKFFSSSDPAGMWELGGRVGTSKVCLSEDCSLKGWSERK